MSEAEILERFQEIAEKVAGSQEGITLGMVLLLVREMDPNVASALETAIAHATRACMAESFLAGARSVRSQPIVVDHRVNGLLLN